MRKEGLEILTLTGHVKGKRYGGQHNLPNEPVIIVGRTMIKRDRKNTKFTKSYKRPEVADSLDRFRSKETWYIDKEFI